VLGQDRSQDVEMQSPGRERRHAGPTGGILPAYESQDIGLTDAAAG